MKVTIEFLHLDHTPSLDERITEKSQKFEKYFEHDTKMNWTCFVKDGTHYAEVTLRSSNHTFYAKAKAENLYKTIDLACDKIEKQVIKSKEKLKNKIHRKKPHLVILDPDSAWDEYESFEYEKKAA